MLLDVTDEKRNNATEENKACGAEISNACAVFFQKYNDG